MARPSFRESKTAFVIIAWNSEAYIEECILSALSLECRELDVLYDHAGAPSFLLRRRVMADA